MLLQTFCQRGGKNAAFCLTFWKAKIECIKMSFGLDWDLRRRRQLRGGGSCVRDGCRNRLGVSKRMGVMGCRCSIQNYDVRVSIIITWHKHIENRLHLTVKYVFCEFVKWCIWDISAGCVCHDSAVDIRKSTALKLSACWSALSRNPFSGYTLACQTSFHIAVGFVV